MISDILASGMLPVLTEGLHEALAKSRPITPARNVDPHGEDVRDILKVLRHRRGTPTVRSIARRANVSPATVSRVFSGKTLPTLDNMLAIATALGATQPELERCRAGWEAAAYNAAVARRARETPKITIDDAPKIVIHGGDFQIEDGATAKGKEIVVLGGNVYLSSAAAESAAQIVVHGGAVHIGADAPQQIQQDHQQGQDGSSLQPQATGRPQIQTHLRRVG